MRVCVGELNTVRQERQVSYEVLFVLQLERWVVHMLGKSEKGWYKQKWKPTVLERVGGYWDVDGSWGNGRWCWRMLSLVVYAKKIDFRFLSTNSWRSLLKLESFLIFGCLQVYGGAFWGRNCCQGKGSRETHILSCIAVKCTVMGDANMMATTKIDLTGQRQGRNVSPSHLHFLLLSLLYFSQ